MQETLEKGRGRFGWATIALLVLVAASLTFTTYSSLTNTSDTRACDTGMYFVAGYAMQKGISPYNIEILPDLWKESLNREFLPFLEFPYPPTALPYMLALSFLPPDLAYAAIDWVNIVALVAVFVALWRILAFFLPGLPRTHLALALLVASLTTATSEALDFGQLTLVFVAAVAWSFDAILRKRIWSAIAILVVIGSLKPQLTLLPGLAMFVLYSRPLDWLKVTSVALVWTGSMVIIFGIDLIPQWLFNVSKYETNFFNFADQMTGIRNLADLAQMKVSSSLAIALAAALSLVVLLVAKRFLATDDAQLRSLLHLLTFLVVCLVTEATVSLHYYDHAFLIVPLALVFALPPRHTLWLLPSLLVAAKPFTVLKLVGSDSGPETLITLALVVATIVAGTLLATSRQNPRALAWSKVWETKLLRKLES